MSARIAARTSCRGEQGKTSMRIGLVVCLVTVLVVAGRRGAPEKGGSFRLSGSFFAQCLEGRTRNEMYWGGGSGSSRTKAHGCRQRRLGCMGQWKSEGELPGLIPKTSSAQALSGKRILGILWMIDTLTRARKLTASFSKCEPIRRHSFSQLQ